MLRDEMDIPISMRNFDNVKHRHVTCLKFKDMFCTFLPS